MSEHNIFLPTCSVYPNHYKKSVLADRVQNKLSLQDIIMASPRFRSNCRHFSRFDFHACCASISKVNRHTLRSPFLPIFFYSPAGGIEDICMYSAWLRTGGFQYSRNIATPRIVASLPYFPHANAYMPDHRARTFPCDFTEYQLRWAASDRQSWQLCVMSSVSFPLFYLFFAEDGTVFLQYWIINIVILRSNCV